MDVGWLDIIAGYVLFLRIILAVTATLMLLSGCDDLMVDLAYMGRTLWRRLTVYRHITRMTAEKLASHAEQRVAILIPAWDEGPVIGSMLRNLLASYAYRNYTVFVGTYPNDLATRTAVAAISRMDSRVVEALNELQGPTSKPDCLGTLMARLRAHEAETGQLYDIFVLHDAEDVVHPLELKVMNHLIPKKDMVQLPVLPLERPLTDLIGNHYLDEFSETHTKDLSVREALTGGVISAGVGCGFSRRAIAALADENGNPFSRTSLTEDYEIALRLSDAGLQSIFVSMPVRVERTGTHTYVATREYFPNTLKDALRQKARWQIGITFQGLEHHGWRGDWRRKYMLFRDRKTVLAAQVNMTAYFLMLNFSLLMFAQRMSAGVWRFPQLVEPGGFIWWALVVNLIFLANRLAHRAAYVWRYYGPAQAIVSAPRQVVGNFINFLAALRATRLYLAHRLYGKPLIWDKTAHAFPTAGELDPFKSHLGAVLMEMGLVSKENLEQALQMQDGTDRRLGDVLQDMGLVNAGDIGRALERQTELRRGEHAASGRDGASGLSGTETGTLPKDSSRQDAPPKNAPQAAL